MMSNLLKVRSEGRPAQNIEDYDKLFEIQLKPLKSKNARKIFKIFVDESGIEYLTTLDLQTKLYRYSIKLSKKEINGWLRTLHDAGLITKGEKRGKPTTMEYEDKYTFDMWNITPKGMEIAEGINKLIRGKTESLAFVHVTDWDSLAEMDADTKQQIMKDLDETYTKLTVLRNLMKAGGQMKKTDLRKGLIPEDSSFEKFISSSIEQGLLKEVENLSIYGSILWFLRLLGLSTQGEVSIHLTEKGYNQAE
jgi:hypothetical protein